MKALSLIIALLVTTFSPAFSQEEPISKTFHYGKKNVVIVCPILPDELRDSKGEIKYQRVYQIKGTQSQLHGIALKYIGDAYKSAKSVIDVNDSQNGYLLVKGTFSKPYIRWYRKDEMMRMVAHTDHNLTFEIKENRIRVTFDNLKIKINDIPNSSTLSEFIDAYNSKDGINGNEEDFRFKANIGLAIKVVHEDIMGFLEGMETYFNQEIKEDW